MALGKVFFLKKTLSSVWAGAVGKVFKKKLCRVPCPWHSAKTPRIAIFFTFHCNRQYIYIYIYINHHIYITNMHYISQAHAYLINSSKIHHKSTKVQHHKFIITSSTSQSSTSLLRRRRLQVWPPRQR